MGRRFPPPAQKEVGCGIFLLLDGARERGSISQAAQKLKMAYRQAWGRLKKAENRLGFTLLEVRIGGEMGGGARLTLRAQQLLKNTALFAGKWRQPCRN